MWRSSVLAILMACDTPVDLDVAPVNPGPLEPLDLADDDQPYELAASCSELVTWPVLDGPTRVAAASAHEAWVVVGYRELVHLVPDGTLEVEPLEGVADVWRCPGVTWVVGDAGLVARKPDGGTWERLELPPGPVFNLYDGGVGCDGDLWIGAARDAVHVHDGTSWRTIPTEPTLFDPDDPALGQLDHDASRVRGAGQYRVAAGAFGSTLAYLPERNAFVRVAGTDDAISDLVTFRNGTGATLYNGHALAFDRDPDSNDGDSILDGNRAARRADDDIWIARFDLAHYDGTAMTVEATPGTFDQDVDARFDAVWVVGFDGAAVRTQQGWCQVAGSAIN